MSDKLTFWASWLFSVDIWNDLEMESNKAVGELEQFMLHVTCHVDFILGFVIAFKIIRFSWFFKEGYADGINDGRESQFQGSFDIGYENGLRNGFLLGKYRATNNAQKTTNDHQQPSNDLILQRVSRGQCIVCIDKSLADGDMTEIIDKQAIHIDKIHSTLKSRYGSTNDSNATPN